MNGFELKMYRPSHYPSATACNNCVFKQPCGGLENTRPLLDCFEQYCCNDARNCDEVCPRNEKFPYLQAEIGGFSLNGISQLHQEHQDLPLYIPMIHHGYRRSEPLEIPFAVVSLYDLFVQKNDRLEAKFASAEAVRNHFRLSGQTQLVLRGTGKDKYLERYWRYREVNGLPGYLGKLGIAFVIGPNFSSFLNVPRTAVMFNRKRHLICLSELSDEGVSVIPHLSVTMPADWRFWTKYLKENSKVRHIAFNFQTGFKNKLQGNLALQNLRMVRDNVGRDLIPILIGGAQFTKHCAVLFEKFTVTDSVPFAKTVRRSSMRIGGGLRNWESGYSLRGQSLSRLLQKNVDCYSVWLNLQIPPSNVTTIHSR